MELNPWPPDRQENMQATLLLGLTNNLMGNVISSWLACSDSKTGRWEVGHHQSSRSLWFDVVCMLIIPGSRPLHLSSGKQWRPDWGWLYPISRHGRRLVLIVLSCHKYYLFLDSDSFHCKTHGKLCGLFCQQEYKSQWCISASWLYAASPKYL